MVEFSMESLSSPLMHLGLKILKGRAAPLKTRDNGRENTNCRAQLSVCYCALLQEANLAWLTWLCERLNADNPPE